MDESLDMSMFDLADDSFLFFVSPIKKPPSPPSPAKKPRVVALESTFQLNGYNYTKNSSSKDKRTAYYLCSKYRGVQKCKAKLTRNSEGECKLNDCHTCLQSGQSGNVVIGQIFDATQEIKLMVEASSMEDVGKPVSVIARRIFDEIKAKYYGK